MKIIKPSFEIIEQQAGLLGIYKQIERAGRICYKSEDKITDDSAEAFVQKMVDSKHFAMCEHGTVYLHIKRQSPIHDINYFKSMDIVKKYSENKYSKLVKYIDPNGLVNYYITSNLRVLLENGWLDDLQYLCEPTEHHEKRYTVKYTCDRGVSHEFVRHRVFSFAQESTRQWRH